MSSDEDYYPPNKSACEGRRRTKRITRSVVRKKRASNLRKSYVKAEKPFITTPNSKMSPKMVKEDFEEKPEKDIGIFSSEPLTPAELNQLFEKFKRDGHFRCTSSTSLSPGPKPRTMDGAKRKKHSGDAKASQRASIENKTQEGGISPHVSDPLSVTLLNPLPSATGSTLHISPDKASYTPLFPPDQYVNWNTPMICQNFLSSGTFRETNGIDSSSNRNSASSFIPPKQYQPPSISNSYEQVPNKPTSNSAWKSFDHVNEPTGPQTQANPCGLYHYGKNLQIGYHDNATNTQRNSYENYLKPSSTQIYQKNVCNGFSLSVNAPGPFQGRQMNSGTSANISQTEISYGNLPCNWVGTAVNNVSSTFTNNSISTSNLTNSRNSPKYHSPGLRGYNSEYKSVNNFISSSGFGENENSIISHNSNPNAPQYMSLMPWNSLQAFPNLCSTGNEPYSNDLHNFPVSSSQRVASTLVNELNNINNQSNCWMQNNLSHRGAFVDIGNEVTSSNVTNLTNTLPATTTTATMLNESTEVTSINGNDTDESTLFIDDIPRDVDICQMVSFSSYDDDIDYENYVEDNIPYNENSVSTTTTLDHELNSALSTPIKTEVRPLYDTSNFSQNTYNSAANNQSAIFYDVGTKKEIENSSDRIIVKDSTIA